MFWIFLSQIVMAYLIGSVCYTIVAIMPYAFLSGRAGMPDVDGTPGKPLSKWERRVLGAVVDVPFSFLWVVWFAMTTQKAIHHFEVRHAWLYYTLGLIFMLLPIAWFSTKDETGDIPYMAGWLAVVVAGFVALNKYTEALAGIVHELEKIKVLGWFY